MLQITTLPVSLAPQPCGRVVTPYDSSGAVYFQLAGRLARHLVEQGSDGLLMRGTTGESPTLAWDEQLKLLEVVREAVGSTAHVLAGTGSNSTSEAVQENQAAPGDEKGMNKQAHIVIQYLLQRIDNSLKRTKWI